jgi:hypothetical protein
MSGPDDDESAETPVSSGLADAASGRPPGLHRVRLNPKLVVVATVLGFGLPILGYFGLILHYGVNDIYEDQWSDIALIKQSYIHTFDWNSLWSQHNENRIFFPNLLVIVLGRVGHFNVKLEELISGCMLVAAVFCLIWAHKRRSPGIPWLYYCPVAILSLSIVQYGATLWGFQLAWYLVLLAMALAVMTLDRIQLTWLALALGIGAAVVGSFSSVQGLLIWPSGLVLLWCRRRDWRTLATWSAAAIVTGCLYFYHFSFSAGSVFPNSLTRHAISPVTFAVFTVGDVVGVPVKFGGSNDAVLILGVIIVVVALSTAVIFGIPRDTESGGPVGVTLICFGLLFAALVARGRAALGYWAASSSGYTMYELLILVGTYLCLLSAPDRLRMEFGSDARGPGVTARWHWINPGMARRYAKILGSVLAVIVLGQITGGIVNGVTGARSVNFAQERAAQTTRHIRQASDLEVIDYLDFSESARRTRELARTAAAHHLGPFGGQMSGTGGRAPDGQRLLRLAQPRGQSDRWSEVVGRPDELFAPLLRVGSAGVVGPADGTRYVGVSTVSWPGQSR